MYLYYFKTDNGRSDKILVSEIVKTGREWRNTIVVYVAHDSEIYASKQKNGSSDFVTTHAEEGKIYKRTFWLNELDMDRARKIVSDYTARKREELIRKLENMG